VQPYLFALYLAGITRQKASLAQ